MQSQFSTVEEALNQLVNGGYIILADNEDRENEGDQQLQVKMSTLILSMKC